MSDFGGLLGEIIKVGDIMSALLRMGSDEMIVESGLVIT
jgi:hypothetical protein